MASLSHYLSGGFLAGKRTYLLVFAAVLTELIHWAVGDQSTGALIDHLPRILSDLGVAALRAGVAAAAQTPSPGAELAASAIESRAKVCISLDENIPDAVREWIAGRRGRP